MTVRERLADYRRQYDNALITLMHSREHLAKLEAELQECERRGEIPSKSLMQDLYDAESWVDWHEHECNELKIQVEECEAYLAEDE